ncbi:MAG: hypothetical protein K6L81_11055 [Agarilytica sp.]
MTQKLDAAAKDLLLEYGYATEFTRSCHEVEDSFAAPRTSIYRPTVTAQNLHR